jgi:N-methylhydantoinase B
VLNAEFPDAVGVRHSSAHRFNDALGGAMMKAVPALMPAPTSGVIVPIVLAENDPRGGGRNITVVEPLVGGRGACQGLDGTDARDNSAANLSNHPVETIEAEIGAVIRRYDIRCDSGGAGEWRGGVGQEITIEVLRDEGMLLARGMDRMRFTAWGWDGGAPAQPLRLIVNRGRTEEREYGKIDDLLLKAGDTVTFLSPGGGGYGDPFRRAPAAVERDVRLGFVSREGAAREYGVVIAADGTVDAAGTEALRGRREAPQRRGGFDFGAERRAWEAVFDDATMLDLNRRLALLPKPQRQPARRRVFDAVAPELGARQRVRFAELLADAPAARARLAAAIAAILPEARA